MSPRRKLGLLACLYLTQGLPFGFFTQTLPVVLRRQQVSLQAIGLSTLLALPWAFKFLLGPIVDRLGERRSWLLPLQLASATLMAALGFADPEQGLEPLLAAVLLVNLLAATHDVAADGLAVDLLTPAERGWGNGIQVAAYRAGMILGGGVVLALLDVVGWRAACFAMAASLLLASAPLLPLREPARQTRERPAWGELLRRADLLPWLGVLVVYKSGDAMGTAMLRPFLTDADLGYMDLAWLLGGVGFGGGLVGALIGGAAIQRLGRRRALLVFGILQAASVAAYALAAARFAEGTVGHDMLGLLIALCAAEHLCGGMATAALFTVMMDACRPQAAATDYTLQACAVVLATGAASALSGFSADALGYTLHFLLSGALALAAALWVGLAARLPDPTPEKEPA